MIATKVGLEAYLAEWGESAADGAEGLLPSVERRLLAFLVPSAPQTQAQKDSLARAAYAQWRHETRSKTAAPSMQNRLRSVKLGEFSATLDGGVGNEQALFEHGLCGEARACLIDSGLFYRGVGL